MEGPKHLFMILKNQAQLFVLCFSDDAHLTPSRFVIDTTLIES